MTEEDPTWDSGCGQVSTGIREDAGFGVLAWACGYATTSAARGVGIRAAAEDTQGEELLALALALVLVHHVSQRRVPLLPPLHLVPPYPTSVPHPSTLRQNCNLSVAYPSTSVLPLHPYWALALRHTGQRVAKS
eukprot:1910972-Rhodomonas_salina.1